MIKKVLDTNVLLDRPLGDTIDSFTEPTHIIIPLIVLNELDKFKKGTDEINEFCRATTRFLDQIRSQGKINQGIKYKEHLIQIQVQDNDLDLTKNDHKIIKSAIDNNAELISQDINVRVVADALNIISSNFAPDDVNIKSLYKGWRTLEISQEEVRKFYQESYLEPGNRRLVDNQFLIMKDPMGGEHEAIYNSVKNAILPLSRNYEAWGIKPMKDKVTGKVIREQSFLMHLLLDPDIQFVTAIGPSGCGKTFITLACALEQTINKNNGYSKVLVMRPLTPMGKDIGFLPGDKLEKLRPWMASTFDALEYLLDDYKTKDGANHQTSEDKIVGLMHQGVLELEAMTYIRGRSIPNQFIIVDDAQNLTQQQAATIITRAGEGTKVVFLGDISPKQIDDHRLTSSNNGLSYVVDKLKGDDIVGHITMEKVVRSRLAQLGVDKL